MEWIIFRLEFNSFVLNWPLAFCFSVRFQMGEAQKWSKDVPTWIGFIYQNILFYKVVMERSDFIMATMRRVLIAY